MKNIHAIGVMSGTSLDGIDLAWCRFSRNEQGGWLHQILKARTIPYETDMMQALSDANNMSALEYCKLHNALGELIAHHLLEFIGEEEKPDFIASHGHTVFHQPADGLTTQIGSGAIIAARTGITTVSDFRVTDVALHGQGAPLVPIGDQKLFGNYDACLNLGGFSNISFHSEGKRVAFDIAPCNMALNHVARQLGLSYDPDGENARRGKIIPSLLKELNNLSYYHTEPPKSLGKEWFEQHFLPILVRHQHHGQQEDLLRTLVEHIAFEITQSLPQHVKTLLVTGGGAHNLFLIERTRALWTGKVTIPDELTIDYKEALIFAFLGLLRLNKENNTLASVTGADTNSCGGCIWHK